MARCSAITTFNSKIETEAIDKFYIFISKVSNHSEQPLVDYSYQNSIKIDILFRDGFICFFKFRNLCHSQIQIFWLNFWWFLMETLWNLHTPISVDQQGTGVKILTVLPIFAHSGAFEIWCNSINLVLNDLIASKSHVWLTNGNPQLFEFQVRQNYPFHQHMWMPMRINLFNLTAELVQLWIWASNTTSFHILITRLSINPSFLRNLCEICEIISY